MMNPVNLLSQPLVYLRVYNQDKVECGWLGLSESCELICSNHPQYTWKKCSQKCVSTQYSKSNYVVDHSHKNRQNKQTCMKQNQTKNGCDLSEQQKNQQKITQLIMKLQSVTKQNDSLKQLIKVLEDKQLVHSNNLNIRRKEICQIIPDPVPYAPISFLDNEKKITYTDCWEISVLRFLHLIFGDKGNINFDKLTQFMDLKNKHCKKLIEYFEKNKSYSFKRQYYQTQEGFLIRAKWCQFLNKSKLMKVKLYDKYEVAATVPNLLAFFRGFFPRLKVKYEDLEQLTYEKVLTKQLFTSYQNLLNQIYRQLSLDLKLQVKLKSSVIYQKQYIFFSTIQNIYLDDQFVLEWEIYQSYDVCKKQIKDRLTGHSDYRYPIKNQQSQAKQE